MATESRRDAAPLKEELLQHPERFEFLQAVRLLARLYPERSPVGGEADPSEELVRFASDLSLSFPCSDVRDAEPAQADRPARLTVCFMGVATPASFGSLPRRYAEEIRALVRAKNTALRDFLDMFNHRLISLFFRAREHHKPALLFERGPRNPFERVLAGVLGIGTVGLAERLALPDRALFARAALLAMRPMPPLALESLLTSVFRVPAEVKPFQPTRLRIDPADRTRLGVANSRLQKDLVLGSEITLLDAKFRVRLGPMSLDQFSTLLPDQPGFRQLVDLTRFATRAALDFDLQLLLDPQQAPGVRLSSGEDARGQLGWSAWIAPQPSAPPAEALLRPMPVRLREPTFGAAA